MTLFKGLTLSLGVNRFSCLLQASRVITSSNSELHHKLPVSRNFSNSNALARFSGDETPNSYTKGPPVEEVLKYAYKNPKVLLDSARFHLGEFKVLANEIRERFASKIKVLQKGTIVMLYTFENDDSIQKFILTTDRINKQGYSTASFVRTQYETAIFSGYLDTRVPKDGKTKFAGYATINSKRVLKSFKRKSAHDWTDYTHLVLKIRGDGRTYLLLLSCPGDYDVTFQDQYHYPLYTRGGPYWQLVKIPFSNFYFTSRSRIMDSQSVMELNKCSRIGITIADGFDGPFKLEIEYFGLEYQEFHKAICPYEEYRTSFPLE